MRNIDFWETAREKATIHETGLKILQDESQSKNGIHYNLKMWKPKGKNPYVNYYFRTDSGREVCLLDQISHYIKRQEEKAARKKERQATPELLNTVKIGDIFHYSWGYDQTNCNYFQVVKKTKKSVIVKEIAGQLTGNNTGNSMAGYKKPIKDRFVEGAKELRKLLQFHKEEAFITMNSFGWCSLWNGKENYCSWYA